MTTPPGRLRRVDALRGFAVCGIMLVNTWQRTAERHPTSLDWAMWNLFQSRFYPIFAFLFGLSFALFLQSARAGTSRPRLVLLRRLAVLAVFGLAHTTFAPGEVLLPYALLGAAVLLPASFLPWQVVLLLGCGTLFAAVFDSDPYVLITAMFLLGLAVALVREARSRDARHGGAGRLAGLGGPDGLGGPAVLGTAAAVAAALSAVLIWRWNHPPAGGGVYQAAALCGAVAYSCAFLLVARRSALFETLGRMALTNYVTGTAVIALAAPVLAADRTGVAVVALAVVTVAAQAVFCRRWLARHRYGPLEWVWRTLTWWGVTRTGQTVSRDPRSAVPDPRRPRPEDQPGDRA